MIFYLSTILGVFVGVFSYEAVICARDRIEDWRPPAAVAVAFAFIILAIAYFPK